MPQLIRTGKTRLVRLVSILCGCALLFALVTHDGIGTESRRAPSPKRRFIERAFIQDGNLQDGWREVNRAVLAYTGRGNADRSYDADTLPIFPDGAEALLRPQGEFLVLAGVDYAHAGLPRTVAARVLYFCSLYPPSLLPDSPDIPAQIPGMRVDRWRAGEDGLAMALPAVPPGEGMRHLYLAADGLFVKIHGAPGLSDEVFAEFASQIRMQLALELKNEADKKQGLRVDSNTRRPTIHKVKDDSHEKMWRVIRICTGDLYDTTF